MVKVEHPDAGNDMHHWGPPFLQDVDGNDTDQAHYFTACNRNKRSVTIDMATEDRQQLVRQMALPRNAGGSMAATRRCCAMHRQRWDSTPRRCWPSWGWTPRT